VLNLNELDQKVLAFWAENNTFERSVENRRGQTPFVIYEGPPTANGRPGIHHVLTRTFKDMIARYQTMQGRFVERKAGWDEHGLPVEIEVQKYLGLPTKKQIVDYGVGKFNEQCAISTHKYIKEWELLTKRMGYWLDLKNAYHTSDNVYIHRVWTLLKQLFENGLIYQSRKVVPWACDSGTVVSNAEVAQGYKTVEHLSAHVLFKLCNYDNTYLLAWTTTPWTLPANMALAVNPKLPYKSSLVDGKTIIHLNGDGNIEIMGANLVGQKYYHPFTHEVCPVIAADFVKAEATGIVHIAPAFGEDDYDLWKAKLSQPIICHIDEDGRFNSPDYKHEYPHNWRTGRPLIYYLRPSWYVAVNKFRDKMIEANETVAWHPEHIKLGLVYFTRTVLGYAIAFLR